MATVHAHVVRFNGHIHLRTHATASHHIVSLLEWEHLLEPEDIFDDGNTSPFTVKSPLVGLFLFLLRFERSLSQADTELLLAMLTDKDQALSGGISGFIKSEEILTFGTTYSFHSDEVILLIDIDYNFSALLYGWTVKSMRKTWANPDGSAIGATEDPCPLELALLTQTIHGTISLGL